MSQNDLVVELESLRYKYLSAKHDGSKVSINEMQDDMILIIWILQNLLDPFYQYTKKTP